MSFLIRPCLHAFDLYRCIEIAQVLTPIFSYSGKKGNEKKNERGYNNGTTVQLGSIEVVISAKSKCM